MLQSTRPREAKKCGGLKWDTWISNWVCSKNRGWRNENRRDQMEAGETGEETTVRLGTGIQATG